MVGVERSGQGCVYFIYTYPSSVLSGEATIGTVARTTARTSNLVVILAGAGLSIVLIYALTSEMFSPNSPTVLYNKACKLIKASPQVCPERSLCILGFPRIYDGLCKSYDSTSKTLSFSIITLQRYLGHGTVIITSRLRFSSTRPAANTCC